MEDAVTTPERRADYLARGLWDDTTLSGRVAEHAIGTPDQPAVVDDEGRRRHTYAELGADAARVAAGLTGLGVAAGDVVSVQLPNWYETVVTAVAIQSLGAVINPLLPNYRARELAHVFTTARPRAVLTPAEYRGFDHVALVAEVVAATGVEPHARRRRAGRGSGRARPAGPARSTTCSTVDAGALGRDRRPRRPSRS